MKRLLALLTLTPALALAQPVQVNVRNVVDGDTIDIVIPGDTQPWNMHRVRLIGINTPEKRSRCDTDEEKLAERKLGALAAAYARRRIYNANHVTVEWKGEDSLNRPLVVMRLDGKSPNDDLLETGHALPYVEGAKGQQWCGR